MDASRFKRRSSTQKRTKKIERQETQKPFGNVVSVPEASSVRSRFIADDSADRANRIARARAKARIIRQVSALSIKATHYHQQHSQEVANERVHLEGPAARRSLLDMSLPGHESPVRQANLHIRWRKARRLAFRGMALSLVFTITLGGLFVSQNYLKMQNIFSGTSATANALDSNVNPDLLKGEGDGRVNVLLLGRGGGKNTSPDLTDTMMVLSVDPVNKKATLLSVPRDLWVKVPGGGPMKINAAWATGVYKHAGKVKTDSTKNPKAVEAGFANVDAVVEEVLGLKIHYNMVMNFDAFKQAVNTVGGVKINVPADLVDPTMANENKNSPLLAKKGANTFDGSQALKYIRSKETTSDQARAERQRAVFLALKSQIQEIGTLSNPVKVSGLLTAFGNNISTDLSFKDAGRLYSIMKSIDPASIKSANLMDSGNSQLVTTNIKRQTVIVPSAGTFKFGALHSYIRTQLQDPFILKEKSKILILNGTQTPGLASKLGDILKTYGYNIVATGNTPSSDWNKTALVDLTAKGKYTKNYLENRLATTASNKLEDTSIPTNGADFVIIVGDDEVITAQTQARQ